MLAADVLELRAHCRCNCQFTATRGCCCCNSQFVAKSTLREIERSTVNYKTDHEHDHDYCLYHDQYLQIAKLHYGDSDGVNAHGDDDDDKRNDDAYAYDDENSGDDNDDDDDD